MLGEEVEVVDAGDVVGDSWDCQLKKLMTGDGVSEAACACQRVLVAVFSGRGDRSGGWFGDKVDGVVRGVVGVVGELEVVVGIGVVLQSRLSVGGDSW